MNGKRCPKCRRVYRPNDGMNDDFLARHHLYPVRHFGKKGNIERISLCWKCHSRLESGIKLAEQIAVLQRKSRKLSKPRYYELYVAFMDS